MARFLAPPKDPHTYVECGHNSSTAYWYKVWLWNDHGPVISEEAFIGSLNDLRKATAGYIAWTDPRGEAILHRLDALDIIPA